MTYDFSTLKKDITETDEWLQRELTGVRTGRATPALMDTVKPEVYGSRTPMAQVASLSIEDARTLRVVPWDKSLVKAIEKAITEADLGVSVATDDMGLRVMFPELTAERRVMLAKIANEKTEHAKVTLRGHRNEAIKALDASEKEGGMSKDELFRYKEEVQKMIDKGTESLEAQLKRKQEEISK
ncbi:MAG: ribosome recycling factor [Candidatus Pacebacteria bacterium]|nr:ribosome recycling factor [Candidatus Paceibacterota bacterium]